MATFVISDTHFQHANIIKYCARPFKDVQEMDEELIRRWNSVVTPVDTVIHVGDFALGQWDAVKAICSRLNGYKILVKGNHDRSTKRMLELGFDEVWPKYIHVVTATVFQHTPTALPEHVQALVHGDTHSHEIVTAPGVLCACVEAINYTPIRLEELLAAGT